MFNKLRSYFYLPGFYEVVYCQDCGWAAMCCSVKVEGTSYWDVRKNWEQRARSQGFSVQPIGPVDSIEFISKLEK